jgi:clan AA aspartic protease (TIGR02281 family)
MRIKIMALALLCLPVMGMAESIPLKLEGGTYVVPVLINGTITLNFTVDTGAAEVSIPADVFGTLRRTETISKADLLQPGEYVLADGTTRREQRFRIRSLKVGNLEMRDVVASVAPSQGNLLLGQSFLSRLRTWSVNNQQHALVLNEGTPSGFQYNGNNLPGPGSTSPADPTTGSSTPATGTTRNSAAQVIQVSPERYAHAQAICFASAARTPGLRESACANLTAEDVIKIEAVCTAFGADPSPSSDSCLRVAITK